MTEKAAGQAVQSGDLLAMPRSCSECGEKLRGGWRRWAAMGACPVARPDLKKRMIANVPGESALPGERK